MTIQNFINKIKKNNISKNNSKTIELPKYDFLENSFFDKERREIIRNTMNKGLPIATLLDLDYTADILKVLAFGLENNIKLSRYINVKKYNAEQLKEILLGIINKIDYEIYNWNEYSAEHMYILRYCLENNIDVSLYADPGLDINKIKSELRIK